MPYLTVDNSGKEIMFAGRPTNVDEKGNKLGYWCEDEPGHFDYGHCTLPSGTIERIIGRTLPEEELFFLNEEVSVEQAIKDYEEYKQENNY